MLRLPPLRHLRPATVEAAAVAVADHPGAMLVAGGTDLVPNLKRRQFDAPVLVSLRGIAGFDRIEGGAKQGMTVGAGATLDQVATHPALQSEYRALAQAAGFVSTPQIRHMGTIGGNLLVDPRCNYYNQSAAWRKAVGYCLKRDGDICLVARSSPRCWAVSSSDSAPVALALQAELSLQSPDGIRRLQAEALYRDDGIAYVAKRPDEVIVGMHLPAAVGLTSAYWKLRRRGSFDFPVLGVAVAIRWSDGAVLEARGALGAVGSRPVGIGPFLQGLVGRRPDEGLLAEIAEAAEKPAKPLDNTDYSHYWRKRMTRVLIERALRQACGLDPLAGRLTAQVKRPN
jgi:4-hydroxybenzoyl-CoA reductase subunit beta